MAKSKTKIAADVLKWRRKQKRGAIMEPETFERIKRQAAARGADDPTAVAGSAYWDTVRAKYKERRRK